MELEAHLSYPTALVLTVLFEAPVWALFGPVAARSRGAEPGVDGRRVLGAGTAASVVTHPLLWFAVLPALEGTIGRSVVALLLAESVIWLSEAAIVTRLTGMRRSGALEVALVANAVSFAAGSVLA